MSTPTSQQYERIVGLDEGLAIYKVHLDAIREQDVNARIMRGDKFQQLVENIKAEKRLESLPFCVMRKNGAGNMEFELVSGHHRTRAARVAAQEKKELLFIYVLVDERELSRDKIVSKQLSHNSLQGDDDPQILKELYQSIQDMDARIQSGILDQELEFDLKQVNIDDVKFDLSFEILNILFLPKQYKEWQEVVDQLDSDAHIGIADMKDWNDFAATVREVSKREDVRNMAAIFVKMIEIVKLYYAARDEAARKQANAEGGKK